MNAKPFDHAKFVKEQLETNPKFNAGLDRVGALLRNAAESVPDLVAFKADWEIEFGLPYPEEMEDLQRWAARIGFTPGEFDRATGRDLVAWIEGFLQRQQDNAPTPPADGPVDGYRWRHNGEVLDGKLPPRAWRLVNYLFHAQDQTATFAELVEPVTGDHDGWLDATTCRKHRTTANSFFRQHGITLAVSIRDDRVILENI